MRITCLVDYIDDSVVCFAFQRAISRSIAANYDGRLVGGLHFTVVVPQLQTLHVDRLTEWRKNKFNIKSFDGACVDPVLATKCYRCRGRPTMYRVSIELSILFDVFYGHRANIPSAEYIEWMCVRKQEIRFQ